MTRAGPDDDTHQQLLGLGYHEQPIDSPDSRPLLVCDVDEVVLHLVTPFSQVLGEMGFELKSHSFRLTGNVFHRETGAEATQEDVWRGLELLFSEQDIRQGIVEGVIEALNALSADADILFLTNLPHKFGDLRRTYLAEKNLDFPLVTNTGSKVPAIQRILSHRSGPIGFVDDTPTNLKQVGEALPDVHLYHFMANDSFRNLAGDIPNIHVSTGDWQQALQVMHKTLVVGTTAP